MDSATPPSSPEYVPTIIPKQQKDTSTKSIEVHSIPLDQYLALGSFQIKSSSLTNIATVEPSHDWIEATDFLPEVSDPEIPWKSLVELWRAHWVRILCSTSVTNKDWSFWRIFILPDDVARGTIDRDNNKLRKALGLVLESIDVSPRTWDGESSEKSGMSFDPWAAGEDSSLFYLFNTLPSPAPSLNTISDHFAQVAMHEVLDSDGKLRGLTTPLYPYQRRSTAMMLQREVSPQMELDPRLEPRVGPDGNQIYYGARDRLFFRNPRFYDSVRGGILAESMGLGKTLMCIALVLATKGHWPKVPLKYLVDKARLQPEVNSLLDLSAATVARHGIPWRKVFEDMQYKEGIEMAQCIHAMEKQVPTYEIPPRPIRSNRSSTFSTPPEQVRLCSGTIIVVPRNLVHQWQSEILKHVSQGALKVLVMVNPKLMLPSTSELATYDIVLFSRTRFESEAKKTVGDDMDWYQSPLKTLHWLRIIIDEGHSFSSSNTNAAVVAERLVRAERRWIVSGTPAKDLLGVEVEMEAMTFEGNHEDVLTFRQKSLEQRREFSLYHEESSGAIKSLGALASNFLKAEPWAGSAGSEDTAKWEDYIYRHEGHQVRTHTSFSACFRRTLENLVIKTRPEDVERDIELPPLSHKIVRLEPSFHDKLTANLFVLLFSSNAVTSERTDVDYLFHKGSSTHLHRLIANLRQSGFYWTGFNADSVRATVDVTSRYLDKKDTNCTDEDRKLLTSCIHTAKIALRSPYWTALSTTEEMGMFVNEWPKKAIDEWAFEECTSPVMLGLTQAIQAQKYVNNNLQHDKPAQGLAAAGLELRAEREQAAMESHRATVKAMADSRKMEKQSIPSSNFHADTIRLFASGVSSTKSPRKGTKKTAGGAKMTPGDDLVTEKPKRGTKRRLSTADASIDLAPVSNLGRTCVTGTTSSKFSYLIDRVLELHVAEKILIFFDANHQAYYISQVLDLFNIKHLIYANTLNNEQRGKYIVLFNTDPGHRVLLMDIKQAAHGLNLSSASRVFFINPVCRPGIEAQAIKRAHRIGQTKPVHVETLLLKGTVEEAMHERASSMTRYEHMQASKFLEDDITITRIIQQARLLPLHKSEREGKEQMAALNVPQQIFGRPGRGGATATGLEKELFGDLRDGEGADGEGKKAAKRQRAVKSRSTTAQGSRKNKGQQAAVTRDDAGQGDDESVITGGALDPDQTGNLTDHSAAASSPSTSQMYNSIFGGA